MWCSTQLKRIHCWASNRYGTSRNVLDSKLTSFTAGLGGSGILSGAINIMVVTIPLNKRPMFQGIFGAVFGLASVLGPFLGGAFTTHVSWRWCFYINLPVGAVVVVILLFILDLPPSKNTDTVCQDFTSFSSYFTHSTVL